MIAPGLRVPEDPATGLAVAPLVGVKEKFGRLAHGVHALTIRQGDDIGRPSDIALETATAVSRATCTRIGGESVVMSGGTIEA